MEPLLGKVHVEGKGFIQPQSTHHLEAHTVDKAQVSTTRREHRRHGEFVERFIDPMHLKDWHNLSLQVSYGLYPQSSASNSSNLNQHIVRCGWCLPRFPVSLTALE